jgi:hypothetical protein
MPVVLVSGGSPAFSGVIKVTMHAIPPRAVQGEEYDVPRKFIPEWRVTVSSSDLPPGVIMFSQASVPAIGKLRVTYMNATLSTIPEQTVNLRVLV